MSSVNRIKLFFIIGLGGMIGALLRFSMSILFTSNMSYFPIDTLFVNLVGSFILAFLLSIMLYRTKVNKTLLTFFTSGIIGSFTTYSTIIIDLISLTNESIIIILIYILSTFLGGLMMAYLGFTFGKRIWSR